MLRRITLFCAVFVLLQLILRMTGPSLFFQNLYVWRWFNILNEVVLVFFFILVYLILSGKFVSFYPGNDRTGTGNKPEILSQIQTPPPSAGPISRCFVIVARVVIGILCFSAFTGIFLLIKGFDNISHFTVKVFFSILSMDYFALMGLAVYAVYSQKHCRLFSIL
ncbi:MAG: hypothetical protein MJE63_20375, partial [Proteobacteria bacterium]|nr:hypothetical protein [Pseudomonadota bacterium]